MDGNGKLITTQSMAQAAGPGLGALLVGLTGAAVALGSDALSFAASAACLLAIRRREPRHTAAARQARPGFRAEAGAGLSYVLREPILRRAVAWNGTANFFVIMVETLDPVFLIRAVHLRPAYVGVLLALGAAGGVAAGLAARPLTRRIGSARISWLSMTVFSLPGLLIPLAGPGWRVLLFAAGWIAWTFGSMLCSIALGSVIGMHATLWVAAVGGWSSGLWLYLPAARPARPARGDGACAGRPLGDRGPARPPLDHSGPPVQHARRPGATWRSTDVHTPCTPARCCACALPD